MGFAMSSSLYFAHSVVLAEEVITECEEEGKAWISIPKITLVELDAVAAEYRLVFSVE